MSEEVSRTWLTKPGSVDSADAVAGGVVALEPAGDACAADVDAIRTQQIAACCAIRRNWGVGCSIARRIRTDPRVVNPRNVL